MKALAQRVALRQVASVFIYTHEAHPGEHYPHLESMPQKLRHAADLRDKLGIERTILVDALDGACHRAYGSMPNMTWIFARSMQPVYKSDWTDAHSVANAIDYFLDVTERRQGQERLAPFRVERLDYRNQDREAFFAGLERSGPKAVEEFRRAF
ncbi:MAG: hypothetical protein GKR89_00955 [Candidatus Latescibacteria bacterium]|nr:hypothetical protein [Candidatus Latescibacterota bacterium]